MVALILINYYPPVKYWYDNLGIMFVQDLKVVDRNSPGIPTKIDYRGLMGITLIAGIAFCLIGFSNSTNRC